MKRVSLVSIMTLLATQSAMAGAHPGGRIEQLDIDGDGQVSREEFQLPEQRRGPMPFARADVDGDGAITREEMLSSLESVSRERSEDRRERVIAMFDAMDQNGDSVVTRLEAEDHAFTRLDADGNGFVTQEEARAMMDQRRERRGERREANS